jgi:hypothetical protein
METYIDMRHGNNEKCRNGDMNMETWTWRQVVFKKPNRAQKHRRFSLISLPYIVCLFVDEETNGSYPLANGLNGLAHLCAYVILVPIGWKIICLYLSYTTVGAKSMARLHQN